MSEILDIAAALSRLLKAENVLLICHKNPDGDTIGSAAALYWALKGLGKTVAVLCADPIPSRYDYMDIGLYTGQFTPGYTVAVDVAGIQLFGDSIAEYTRRIDMCIDHHPSNSGYADCMLLDGDAAATAEIIYELLTAIGTEITPTIADCLYTGPSTKTGTRHSAPRIPAASSLPIPRPAPTRSRQSSSPRAQASLSSTTSCSRANPAAVWPLSAWRWKAWNTALAGGAPRSTLQKSRSPRPAPTAPIWRVSPACPA